MAVNKATRLSKIAREFNVGISTIVDYLDTKGHKIDSNPNSKISPEQYALLQEEFSSDLDVKKASEKVNLRQLREKKESVSIADVSEEEGTSEVNGETAEDELLVKDHSIKSNVIESAEPENIKVEQNINLNVVGKIDLEEDKADSEVEETAEEEVSAKEEPVVEEKEETPEIIEEVETPEREVEEVIEDSEPEIEEDTEGEGDGDDEEEPKVKVVGKIDLASMNQKTRPDRKSKEEKKAERIAKGKQKLSKNKEEGKSKPEKTDQKSPAAEETQQQMPVVEGQELSEEDQPKEEFIKAKVKKLSGPTVLGKIDLPKEEKKPSNDGERKKKRKRIRKEGGKVDIEKQGAGGGQQRGPQKKGPQQKGPHQKGGQGGQNRQHSNNQGGNRKRPNKKRHTPEISEEDVQKQVKDTLARLTAKGKSKASKYRRDKRDAISQKQQEEIDRQEAEKRIIKVTEFVSVSELATMMDVQVNELISTCMNLGLVVSINQRLDAETMSLLADEFGYKVEFISAEVQEAIEEEEDNDDDLESRPPIVTVMGHVDHGKTKLLDYIRNSNVIGGEAGGITQHIGAYSVSLEDGRKITFLDTPGHEAFTAMRARGAQVTDVSIIVVAADDGVKPQTVEAINHAQAAGVPMVFAINKIDLPTSNPDKVKEELSQRNILVEDWGGSFQSQELSAKSGLNIEDLLEKVLLEAEMLELKANPRKKASGTIIESQLDKGRGYVSTVLVEGGTLKIGDIVLAGGYFGRVKAMYNERNKRVKEAGPATPVLILGLNGAPQAGDKFNIMDTEREAREIANKREQLQREQGIRTQKHITLDEIGRRIAIGNFQELNVIVKGDVDGSVEALSDSLLKLSTEEIQVKIVSKGVGGISEADIYLAAASNAIIIGFQVRPSLSAKKLAEKEEIDIRLYSIIYDAIEEIKAAMEGMLSPDIKEEITATLEIQETFKITGVGTIAGCIVREGKIKRSSKVRVIRDGIVIYTGELGSLKRFKDDAKEVVSGLECGLNIENFNDIKVGDMVESYEEIEVKKTL